MGLIGGLLDRAARATPTAVEDRETGWWLRCTDNGTWWSGAVLAHGASDRLDARIGAVERFYAEHRGVARFQVCDDCPPGLDRALGERGYHLASPVSMLTAVAGGVPEPDAWSGMTVRVDASADAQWLAVLSATSGPAIDVRHETRLLGRVDRPYAFLTVLTDGDPVGIARTVADDGWTGVFHMATVSRARRRGVARRALSAAARWADEQGSPDLYLQVEQSNDVARRLYEGAGFIHLAQYHYRVRARESSPVPSG